MYFYAPVPGYENHPVIFVSYIDALAFCQWRSISAEMPTDFFRLPTEDLEKGIDHAVIMRAGRILRDCSFDELKEEFCLVRVTALGGELPSELPFADVVEQQRTNGQAVITVKNSSPEQIEQTAENMNCRVEIQTLPLEDIYRIVVS